MNEHEEVRLSIINSKYCKPTLCNLECAKFCLVNRGYKICVSVNKQSSQTYVNESMCIGCGVCVKKCPFGAIKIVKLPSGVGKNLIHRFGPNGYALYRLPVPKANSIVGIVGTNGIGKTTALKILTHKCKPNFGEFDCVVSWDESIKRFKNPQLSNFFKKSLQSGFKSSWKLQFVDKIPTILRGRVGEFIKKFDDRQIAEELIRDFEFEKVLGKFIPELSGGELQKFMILVTLIKEADIYVFDEPTSYLDIKQRILVSNAIQKYKVGKGRDIYTMVVEHDMSVLDYISDSICCMFGKSGVFGVVSLPYTAKNGINVFLEGYLPQENICIREGPIDFKFSKQKVEQKITQLRGMLTKKEQERQKQIIQNEVFKYPGFEKSFDDFSLTVSPGSLESSQITVLLGQNGSGKSTFLRVLAGLDKSAEVSLPQIKISFKPQGITPKYPKSVGRLLKTRLKSIWQRDPDFNRFVFKPMKLEPLFNREVKKLSGGQLQRLALVLALGKQADLYLIDEPSAYLDVEQRILASKCIKNFALKSNKTLLVVEHDFIMATYLADKIIVFEGTPGLKCRAHSPQSLVKGMNQFLKMLGISFRSDGNNYRPRINKLNSALDKRQKNEGTFFYIEQ